MAESASLASSDLVDISPLESTAATNVESASLLSWPVPEAAVMEEEEEMQCDGVSLSSSSSSSIQRLKLTKTRTR